MSADNLATTHIDGLRINHYERGAGPAVVFLHGWGSNLGVFKALLDGLADHYRVLALDLPGFGGSQEPPKAWGVDDYADFVLKYLDQTGVREAVLIGHSNGGRIIIKLASRAGLPLTINKIVLVDSAGLRRPLSFRRKVRVLFYKALKKVVSLKFIESQFPDLLEKWRQKQGSADYRLASPRMRECLVKIINEDLSLCLPLIKAPTLLVWGENDLDTPVDDARRMEKLIPEAGLVVLKNAGHYSFLDQAFIFSKVLDSFLNVKR